ncbi:hypothetical protein B0H13DRAFT_1955765 [Mycena leptocephala]|nr:hypothetical protein B0H13DRAFT_1955765 [Mycena leptocephala]
MLVSSRLAVRISSPARIARPGICVVSNVASFPPKKSTKPAPFTELDGTVDPALFLQLRQRIIERHNPSSVELDEPLINLVNKNIVKIRRGLEQRDVPLIRASWVELRQANHLHILTREVVQQIGRLVTASLLPGLLRRSFVEEVALAAAEADSTDALNACFLAYLKMRDSRAVLELYEKFQRLPKTRDISHLNPSEEGIAIVPPIRIPGDALTAVLDMEIPFHRPTTEEFLQPLPSDLQNCQISRPATSLSKHIDNLSKRSTPVLEDLYNSIVEAMTEPDAYIAADAKFITSIKSVAMSEVIWASFLAAFLRRERNDLAAKLWKDVTKFGLRLGIMTWNMVINVYSDRRATKEPDGYTYCALISTLLAARMSTEALQWFKTFETDVKPNSSVEQTLPVYNAVLHGLLDHANAETAFSIFQRMQDEGPKPDLVSYNTVLTYHGRQGNFKAMAAVAGRADAPEMVINIMRKQGVKASVATYSAIINSQMREQTVQHLQAAMHLLHEMEMDPDVAPNEITYTSILAGLYRGEWLSADQIEMYKQDIIARMKKRKISFKTQGYNILIKACLTSEDPKGLEDGLGFYKEMDRRKIPRSDDTWYIMLAGLIDRGAWQLADDVVREMLSSGAQPGNSVSRLVKKVRNHSRV